LKKPLFPEGILYTFVCVYMTQDMTDLGKTCEAISANWAT